MKFPERHPSIGQPQIGQALRIFCLLLLLIGSGTAVAQDDEPAPPIARLVVSSNNVEAIPTIQLRLWGRDGEGRPIDFAQESLNVQNNGVPVGPVAYQGNHQVGTFTLFLIDIPTGVSGQLTAVQELIQQFASPQGMMEQVDSVAVYQVGASSPAQLLEPTSFYNSVRNLFATPLTPETQTTALLDSTVSLIEQIDSLKPNAEMAASIVLVTDGTDSVSVQNDLEDVTRAALEAGVPLHSVWLANEDLGAAAQTFGQEFLAEESAETGGIAVQLNSNSDWPLIWDRISGFRDHATIQYTATDLVPGEFPITLTLDNDSTVRAETAVNIPQNIPSIVIELPADSRTLTLPNVDEPVSLSLNTTLTWLDGVERTLQGAQLEVNGETAADIPVDDITQFEATTDKLQFGNNLVQVVVLDEQGIVARSPEILLTVNEGARQIPDSLDAGGGLASIGRILLLITAVLGVALAVWYFAWRSGRLSGLGLPTSLPRGRRRGGGEPQVTITDENSSYTVSTRPLAYLEVMETASNVSGEFPLQAATVKIGRSPTQADIAFEEDVTVSRLHASLMLEGNHYRIFDQKSTSGTWVNERQVPEYGTQLRDGDEIHLGAVHLRFRQP